MSPIFQGKSDEDKAMTRIAAEKRALFRNKLKSMEGDVSIADALTGVIFDDWSTHSQTELEEGSPLVWSQMCTQCKDKARLDLIDTCGAETICGVEGCRSEADYYYDFDPKILVREAVFQGKSEEDKAETERRKVRVGDRVIYTNMGNPDLHGEQGVVLDTYPRPGETGAKFADVRFDFYPTKPLTSIRIHNLKKIVMTDTGHPRVLETKPYIITRSERAILKSL